VDLRGVEPLSEELEAKVTTSVAGYFCFAPGLTRGGVFSGLSSILFPLTDLKEKPIRYPIL